MVAEAVAVEASAVEGDEEDVVATRLPTLLLLDAVVGDCAHTTCM